MIIEQGTNYVELEISSPAPGSKARRLSVGVGRGDFRGVLAEVSLEPGELEAFVKELRDLEKSRQGQASLSAENSLEFKLVIASTDRSGHLEVSGNLARSDREASASIAFRFDIDPSALPQVLRDFELIGAAA
jgi:hypothetical protein